MLAVSDCIVCRGMSSNCQFYELKANVMLAHVVVSFCVFSSRYNVQKFQKLFDPLCMLVCNDRT